MAYNDDKPRNQGQIQEPCHILDQDLCNFLLLPIFA